MVVYIFVTLLVVLLGVLIKDNFIYTDRAQISDRQKSINRVSLFFVYFVLAFLSGTRVAVGNDYWVYRDNFKLIAQQRVVSSEIGFNGIVKLVQWFAGYDNYKPVFFVFSAITVFFFVKALYDQSEWFAASLFLLLANGFYFSSLNTVRYYLAFAIALFSIKLLWQEKHLAFLLLILVTATIHKTFLCVIPIYYLAKINWKKRDIPFVAVASVLLLVLKGYVRKIMFIIYPYYEGTYLDDNHISYINILKATAVLVFSVIYYKKAIKGSPINRFYFNLNIGALIVFSCLWYLPETTRLGYYLSASNIFLIPSIIKAIDNRKQRIFWAVVIGLAYMAFFLFYLRSLYAVNIRILPYYNLFFA
ncbi:MAG: EpsG family protein [Lachnospiraceae bacterium]|nr:EpsG family protein [Lachnospiraceae bacterium]